MKKEWKLNIILFRFARSILLLSSTSFRFNTKLLSNGSEGYSKKHVLIYCNCFPSGILPALWISTDVLIAPVLVTYGNLIRHRKFPFHYTRIPCECFRSSRQKPTKGKEGKRARKITEKTLVRLKRQESKYLLSAFVPFSDLYTTKSALRAGSVSVCLQLYRLSIEKLAIFYHFHNALERPASQRIIAVVTIKINFQFKKCSIVGICFPLITTRLLSAENNQFEGKFNAIYHSQNATGRETK